MQEEMKCPTCGGDKFKFLGGNSFRCAYCGAVFADESKNSEQLADTPKQTEVVTRVEYIPQQASSQSTGSSVAKGMATGAGAAAGGCLTGTLMAVLIPIIAIVIILAFVGSCIDSCTSALF